MESDAATSVQNKNKKLEYIIDYCRVCMCRRDGGNMISIFDSQGQDDNIVGRIQFCTGVEFKIEDGLPTHICNNCTQNLTVAYKFKTSCLESENVCRKILQDLNDFLNNYDDDDHDGDTELNYVSNENVRKSMDFEDEDSKENVKKSMELEDKFLDKFSNENVRKSVDIEDEVLEKVSNENIRKSMDFEDEVSNENVRKSMDIEAQELDNISNENVRITKARVKKKNDSTVDNQVIEKLTGIKTKQKEMPKMIRDPHKKSKPTKNKTSKVHLLKCEPCNLKFKSKAESAEHKQVAHKNELSMCQVCGKVFRERRYRAKHMLTHQPPKYECAHCDYKSHHKTNLTTHIVRRHGVKRYECDLCSRSFVSSPEISKHIRTFHEGVKEFQCDICDKRFDFRYELKTHIKTHYDKSTLRIEKDEEKIIEKKTGKIIVKGKERETSKIIREKCSKTSMCEVCGKVLITRRIRDMRLHMATHQPPKFECDHCDYKACKRDEMVSHMRRHGGVKRFKCELCSRSYYTESQLNKHIRACHEVKKFQCDICDKRFSVKSILNRHTKTHEEKQHECEVCHRRFLTRYYWRVHLKQHHGVEVPLLSRRGINRKQTLFDGTRALTKLAEGEKRYQCELCPRSYTTFSHLDCHILSCHEAGKKPECNICNKQFVNRVALKTHMDIHDESTRIECEICHNTFSRRAFWRLHLRRQHGLKAPVPSCPRRLSPREEMALLLSNNTGAIAKSHAKQTLATDN